MGLYSKYIFPLILELGLGRKEIQDLRRELLQRARGDVLEIGFGTGLNLPHYPSQIKKLTVVEPNTGMQGRALKRIQKSGIQVEQHALRGESLPFADGSFDMVVSTFTLCSIADERAALREILRVLKPGGKLLFMEHGLADREGIRVWQRRLNPLNRRIADGCHLDRDIESLVAGSGLRIASLKKFYFEKAPKVFGYFYQGVGEKAQ